MLVVSEVMEGIIVLKLSNPLFESKGPSGTIH